MEYETKLHKIKTNNYLEMVDKACKTKTTAFIYLYLPMILCLCLHRILRNNRSVLENFRSFYNDAINEIPIVYKKIKREYRNF